MLTVWIYQVTISGTNSGGTTIYPTITGCANTISGASSNIITGTLGCTNNINTITFSSADVKAITINYASGSPLTSGYGTYPDQQYVVISAIPSTICGPLAEMGEFLRYLRQGQPKLDWPAPKLLIPISFELLRSQDGASFEPLGSINGNSDG